MKKKRAFKDEVYGELAAVAKALANPKRLEILDLLLQGPLTVDRIADGIDQAVGNTSQHLQVLKRSHVVRTRRQGTSIEYRLAPGVAELFVQLRRVATERNPAIGRAQRDWFAEEGAPERIERDELRAGLERGEAVLLDVRPSSEFARAHVPGAVGIPYDQLPDRVDELPTDKLIVATCRGPFCTFAADAVRTLRASGRQAVRFEDGVGEWALDGGRLVTA